MARVDPDDDSGWRYVVRHYRYDPLRRERRHVVVAAFDNWAEYRACIRATSAELDRRRAAGADVDPREHVTGVELEPGYRQRAANGRLLHRAISRRVSLGRWADELELPSSVTFARASSDEDLPDRRHEASLRERVAQRAAERALRLREGAARRVRRGLAVPSFRDDPADLVRLGIDAEQAGFDGYFLWDHLVWSDTGAGPPILDPWQVLAAVAVNTTTIKIGTMITPVPRRRPWQLAKETTTLDRLSGGRLILGVGIGSPSHGDFGIFGEPEDERVRAELLDEGLDVLAGLWSGDWFSYHGRHYTVGPVRFSPAPVQRPRIPIWVGGILPSKRPVARAARWDGMVPINAEQDLVPAHELSAVRDRIAALRGPAEFDLVVWTGLEQAAGDVDAVLPSYQQAGVTWWIECARPETDWWQRTKARVARGR